MNSTGISGSSIFDQKFNWSKQTLSFRAMLRTYPNCCEWTWGSLARVCATLGFKRAGITKIIIISGKYTLGSSRGHDRHQRGSAHERGRAEWEPLKTRRLSASMLTAVALSGLSLFTVYISISDLLISSGQLWFKTHVEGRLIDSGGSVRARVFSTRNY